MRACTSPIQALKSASAILTVAPSVGFALLALGGRFFDAFEGLQNVPFENFYLLLRGLELLLAVAGELQAALVRGERLLERQLPAFHACNDFFQLGQRLL